MAHKKTLLWQVIAAVGTIGCYAPSGGGGEGIDASTSDDAGISDPTDNDAGRSAPTDNDAGVDAGGARDAGVWCGPWETTVPGDGGAMFLDAEVDKFVAGRGVVVFARPTGVLGVWRASDRVRREVHGVGFVDARPTAKRIVVSLPARRDGDWTYYGFQQFDVDRCELVGPVHESRKGPSAMAYTEAVIELCGLDYVFGLRTSVSGGTLHYSNSNPVPNDAAGTTTWADVSCDEPWVVSLRVAAVGGPPSILSWALLDGGFVGSRINSDGGITHALAGDRDQTLWVEGSGDHRAVYLIPNASVFDGGSRSSLTPLDEGAVIYDSLAVDQHHAAWRMRREAGDVLVLADLVDGGITRREVPSWATPSLVGGGVVSRSDAGLSWVPWAE